MTNLTNPNFIDAIFHKINDSTTFPQAYYEPSWLSHDNGTSPMSVIGPNGDAVSMTSTINTEYVALFDFHSKQFKIYMSIVLARCIQD